MSTLADPFGPINGVPSLSGGREARKAAPQADSTPEPPPGQVAMVMAGQPYRGRPLAAPKGIRVYLLERTSGEEALLIADAGQGPRCTCPQGKDGGCSHVAFLRAAGIFPPAAPSPGQNHRSLSDWAKNAPDEYNPWAGYSDRDLEEMARYFGEW